jgi:hypothetical protein
MLATQRFPLKEFNAIPIAFLSSAGTSTALCNERALVLFICIMRTMSLPKCTAIG